MPHDFSGCLRVSGFFTSDKNVAACLADTEYILPVKCVQGRKNLHLALGRLFLHTVTEVSHIGNRHIAAAAAAFHIVHAGLAKEGHPAAAFQGQKMVFIFQQHHTLGCRFPGQGGMRLGSGHDFPVFSQGEHGQEFKPLPFMHVHSPFGFLYSSAVLAAPIRFSRRPAAGSNIRLHCNPSAQRL